MNGKDEKVHKERGVLVVVVGWGGIKRERSRKPVRVRLD